MRISYKKTSPKLQEWNKKWLLQFSEEKCEVMHLGRGNPAYQYHVGITPLPTTEGQKDLGAYVTRLPVKAKSVPIAADGLNLHHSRTMPQYRLIHLNGPGPADLTRWIFAYAGIPYEDEPIDKEDWPVKRKTVFTGKVPVLMVDDEPLFNSVAIASYAAKVAGLVPEDSFDATLCLAVVGTMQEINFNSWKIWRSNKSVEEKKEEYTSKFFPNAVKPFLERLEERLSGMEWTVSDKITWADLSIALWFGELLDYRPDLLEPFPSVVAAMQKVRDVPGIKHLIETTAKPRY